MGLRIKLTSIIFLMILAVIAVISVFTLARFGALQTSTTYDFAAELAGSQSIEIQRRIETFTGYAKILSQLFSDFENIAENSRRDSFTEFLRGAIAQNQNITDIWTAWLPGTIDSRDAELGQFQSFFTRRMTGNVEFIVAGYEGWQDFSGNMTDKPVIASPVWIDVFGYGNVPVVSVMYPVKDQRGFPAGLVGISYISDMQEIVDEIVKGVYSGHGIAAVYANDGAITAHYDKNRIKDNIATNAAEIQLLGNQHNLVVESIRSGGDNGRPVVIKSFSDIYNTDFHLIFEPIFIEGMDTPWSLLLGIPLNEMLKPVRKMIILTVIFSAVMLAVFSVIIFFAAQSIVSPIIRVTGTLKDISEGDGDLTKRINNNSKDEVGELSRYFNDTLDKIKNLVINIKTEAVKLSKIGHDLASDMNQTAAAVNQITANIQNIKARVINQSAGVTQTNAAMEQVTININRLNAHVEQQSTQVSQASAAIEQMVANIHSVTDTLVMNTANVKHLKEASEIGRSGLHTVVEDIKEIARESEGLMEINSVMNNIASQTNLLSMNAAIEAAHAGDSGRGFAVVSDEIRKLAESSGVQSRTISLVLKKIKESIDHITRSTEGVLARFNAIDSSVKTVADQESVIRNAMEEQETGSRQVLEGVANMSEITRQVKTGSGEMLSGAKEVILESNNLEKLTQEIAMGMNEMASGADQINIAVNHVNDISGKTREGIEALMREVSRFKV